MDSERLGKSMDSRNDREREMRDGGFLEVEAGGGGYYGKRILKKNCGIGFLIAKQKLEGKTKIEELSSTVISHRSLVIAGMC